MKSNEAWCIFISGRGSNAQAVYDLSSDIKVGLCLASKAGTWGAARAQRAGVPTKILTKPLDWQQIELELKKYHIQKIFLLGFMHIIPPAFLKKWKGRIYNLHPSLLPAYPGLRAIEKSHDEGAAMGVSIHHVIEEMDAGPLIAQKRVLPAAKDQKRHSLTLSDAQFLISVAEQKSVQKCILQINHACSAGGHLWI